MQSAGLGLDLNQSPMKTITSLLFLSILFISSGSAQKASKHAIERRIEIENGDDPKVTITTTEDGKTVIEELEGAAAQAYLEEREKTERSTSSSSIVTIEINEDDIEEMKDSMRKVKVELEDELSKVTDELKNINLDSIMESIGVEIERSMDEVRYEFNTQNGQRTRVMVFKSNGHHDEDVDIDVEVITDDEDDAEHHRTTVTRTKMIIEDQEEVYERSSGIKEVNVFPIPSDGAVSVSYSNGGTSSVKVQIQNMQGKPVREMKINGKGEKSVTLNLDDLPAGNYLVVISEGKSRVTKKLILE